MRKCKTPGSIYTTVIHNGGCAITTMVTLPHTLVLDKKDMKNLKRKMHTALESVLGDTFDFVMVRASLVRSRHKYMIVKKDTNSKHKM